MNIYNHYDISKYVFDFVKDKYKYIDKWYYLNNEGNWVYDINCKKLKKEIMTTVVNDIIIKSIENINDDIICSKLIKLSIQLKDIKYLNYIINELRQFY